MLIQGNQPWVVKLKWLQLAQELFYLKRLAFSVWEAHIMRACRSGTGHSLYKQTGYDRCDSSHCLYSLFGMKYRLHTLGKKCWLNMEEIACLLTANRWHLWFYLLPAQLQDRPTAGPAPTFMAKGLFFPLTSLEVAQNPKELSIQTHILCWAFHHSSTSNIHFRNKINDNIYYWSSTFKPLIARGTNALLPALVPAPQKHPWCLSLHSHTQVSNRQWF